MSATVKVKQSEELKNLIRYSKKELLFKFVVIGDFGVGKTSIIKRYAEGIYSSTYKITIGADFAVKIFDWDEYTRVTLQLWDIAGHERFGSLTSVYYRYSDAQLAIASQKQPLLDLEHLKSVAAAVVFDLTRPETFNSVEKWLSDLRDKVAPTIRHPLPIVLLANKGDVNVSNLPSDIPDFCKKHNILAWYITSAKDDANIDEAMYFLTRKAVENHENDKYSSDEDNDSIVLNNTQDRVSKRYPCCNTS